VNECGKIRNDVLQDVLDYLTTEMMDKEHPEEELKDGEGVDPTTPFEKGQESGWQRKYSNYGADRSTNSKKRPRTSPNFGL
jgi:hypothetical protein